MNFDWMQSTVANYNRFGLFSGVLMKKFIALHNEYFDSYKMEFKRNLCMYLFRLSTSLKCQIVQCEISLWRDTEQSKQIFRLSIAFWKMFKSKNFLLGASQVSFFLFLERPEYFRLCSGLFLMKLLSFVHKSIKVFKIENRRSN